MSADLETSLLPGCILMVITLQTTSGGICGVEARLNIHWEGYLEQSFGFLPIHPGFEINSGDICIEADDLLGAAAAKLFERVTNNLVDSVSKRATELYG